MKEKWTKPLLTIVYVENKDVVTKSDIGEWD